MYERESCTEDCRMFNPLNTELNPIRHLLALAGAHHFVHVSRVRVKHVCEVVGSESADYQIRVGDLSARKTEVIRYSPVVHLPKSAVPHDRVLKSANISNSPYHLNVKILRSMADRIYIYMYIYFFFLQLNYFSGKYIA